MRGWQSPPSTPHLSSPTPPPLFNPLGSKLREYGCSVAVSRSSHRTCDREPPKPDLNLTLLEPNPNPNPNQVGLFLRFNLEAAALFLLMFLVSLSLTNPSLTPHPNPKPPHPNPHLPLTLTPPLTLTLTFTLTLALALYSIPDPDPNQVSLYQVVDSWERNTLRNDCRAAVSANYDVRRHTLTHPHRTVHSLLRTCTPRASPPRSRTHTRADFVVLFCAQDIVAGGWSTPFGQPCGCQYLAPALPLALFGA